MSQLSGKILSYLKVNGHRLTYVIPVFGWLQPKFMRLSQTDESKNKINVITFFMTYFCVFMMDSISSASMGILRVRSRTLSSK